MYPIIRLFDAFNDPVMGSIADHTKTRWGKFRPYLLWGAILYGICGYLMFASTNLGSTGKLIYAYITYALMLMSYTVINVPYSSLLGVISPSSRTRTVASSFCFVGAFASGFLISLLIRAFGREMIGSLFKQALVARRQQAHCLSVATVVEFEPEHFQQNVALVCYYNGAKFHYFFISCYETFGKHLRVMSCLPDSTRASSPMKPQPPARRISPVHLLVWPVRTWPVHRVTRTLTSSNTGRDHIA